MLAEAKRILVVGIRVLFLALRVLFCESCNGACIGHHESASCSVKVLIVP